jgi:hypothetical protein
MLGMSVVRSWANKILISLQHVDKAKWHQGIEQWLVQTADMFGRFAKDKGIDFPDVTNWVPAKKAMQVIGILGWQETQETFDERAYAKIIELLKQVVVGEKLDLGFVDGVFSSDIAQTRYMTNMLWLISGASGF